MSRHRSLPILESLLVLIALTGLPSAAVAADGAWRQIATQEVPAVVVEPRIAYDSARNRLLTFSGTDTYSSPRDLYALDLGGPVRWTRIPVAGAGPAGYGGSIVYDPIGDRVILYGGYNTVSGSDLFQLTLSGTPTWSPLTATGSPPAHSGHAAVFDAAQNRMIVYGGWQWGQEPQGPTSDVWELRLDGIPYWNPRPVNVFVGGLGPGARDYTLTAWDAARNRMLVYGGLNSKPLGELWALSLEGTPSWTLLAGADADGPTARFAGAAAYDATNDRFLVHGGQGAFGSVCADAWAYSLAPDGGWTQLDPGNAPGPRSYFTGVFDPGNERFIVFANGNVSNDAWSLSTAPGATWSLVHPGGPELDVRKDPALVWDPVRQRALLFGGQGPVGVTGDLWQLTADRAEWQFLGAGHARSGASAVWDPVRNRLLVFGGDDGVLHSDLASWTDGATSFTGIAAMLGPSTRKYAAAAYDPVRDRVLFFAGYPAQNARNQVWSLALGGASPAWTQLTPAGTAPSQRWGHTLTYDPVHDRMLMFGGGDGGVSNQLYELSLSASGSGAWTAITGPGSPPPARTFHSAIYDPVNDRLLIAGGKGAYGIYLNDTWEYRFDGSGWRQLTLDTSPVAQASSAVYDPVEHRMVLFGDYNAAGSRRDTWTLDLAGQVTAVPAGTGAALAFALRATPNPSFAAPKIAFSLPDGSPAKLELIDLAGRRVRATDVGSLGAGRHVVDLGTGGAIAPGLYFARLSRAGVSQVARVCVMK